MAFVYWIHLSEHTDFLTQGYIGFTSRTVQVRFEEHLEASKRQEKNTSTLYNAILKHGPNIILTTLLEGSSEYCLNMEYRLRPVPEIGWNTKAGGEKGMLGYKFPQHTRAKLSAQRQGKLNNFFGKKHTEAAKEKIADSRRGTKASPELRQKLRERALSPENKHRGAKRSIEGCQNISQARRALNLRPWQNGRVNKDVWKLAGQVHAMYTTGLRQCDVARSLDVIPKQLETLFQNLRQGWNPNQDASYLEWKDKHG